jgi:DNA-binding NarL/FixJ family response regulator
VTRSGEPTSHQAWMARRPIRADTPTAARTPDRLRATGSSPPPDPLAATAYADEKRFDVLVTDVVMPQVNGRELATQLRERDSDLRVVYMSGHPAGVLPGDLLEDELSVFLQKPFKMLEPPQTAR